MKLMLGTAKTATAIAWLSDLFPGRRQELEKLRAPLGIEINVAAIKPAYSGEQQGYYWRSLHAFGEHLGYSRGEVETHLHPVICADAYGHEDTRTLIFRGHEYAWPVPRETSSKDANGRKRDHETYSVLIESLIRFAADNGYVIPPAERKAS